MDVVHNSSKPTLDFKDTKSCAESFTQDVVLKNTGEAKPKYQNYKALNIISKHSSFDKIENTENLSPEENLYSTDDHVLVRYYQRKKLTY